MGLGEQPRREDVAQRVRRRWPRDPGCPEPVGDAAVGVARGDREDPTGRSPVEVAAQDLSGGARQVDALDLVLRRTAKQDRVEAKGQVAEVEGDRQVNPQRFGGVAGSLKIIRSSSDSFMDWNDSR